MSASRSSIDDVLSRRRILILCGTGGVGKTTLSAAIAIRSALQGKRTVVVTIDPAKRLATSLGLDQLGDHPTDLTEQVRAACRKIAPERADFQGKIEAIVPDTRRTFESFVRSLASSDASAERVMRNPIFQVFAKEFSGTNEYMALERLFALSNHSEYDCIILDTPPSRNTLAFLDAPKVLSRLFEEKLIRWLAVPANKLMATGMKMALHVLERLTGRGFMTSLVEFSAALFEVQASFSANLKAVMNLLKSEQVGVLMVTTPTPDTVPEVGHFIHAVRAHQLHFEGIAINRALGTLPSDPKMPDSQAVSLIHSLQKREEKIIAELCGTEIPICARLPELARDVHSVEDLLHVALALAPRSDL